MKMGTEIEEIVQRWIARADGHVVAARALLSCAPGKAADAICYHCHEAVATLVKAALTIHGIVSPRIHDLEYLHRMIPPEHRFPADPKDLSWLSVYGIERWWDPDEAQAQQAFRIVLQIRQSARNGFGDRFSWSAEGPLIEA